MKSFNTQLFDRAFCSIGYEPTNYRFSFLRLYTCTTYSSVYIGIYLSMRARGCLYRLRGKNGLRSLLNLLSKNFRLRAKSMAIRATFTSETGICIKLMFRVQATACALEV